MRIGDVKYAKIQDKDNILSLEFRCNETSCFNYGNETYTIVTNVDTKEIIYGEDTRYYTGTLEDFIRDYCDYFGVKLIKIIK